MTINDIKLMLIFNTIIKMNYSTKLHTIIDNFQTEFTLLQYNVDQSMREEATSETKWNNRYPRVKKLIDEVNADIVCLQEMRKLPDTISVNHFLALFPQYSNILEYRNAHPLAFGQAILYKPEKFYPLQTVKRWLSETPNTVSESWTSTPSSGYIVVGTQFMPVHDTKVVVNTKPFWVFNVHFGMEEELKTRSCFKLLEITNTIANGDEYIISGDFNFFPDKDGSRQREILTNELKDLGQHAHTLTGKHIEGTFVGYEHDEYKANLNHMISRLDNVFSTNLVHGYNPTLYTKTMHYNEPIELTTRDFPSDHLPLVINIVIKNHSHVVMKLDT